MDSAKKLLELNKIKPKTKIGLNSIINFINKWVNDYKKGMSHIKLFK